MRLAFAILCTCALLVTPASAADWRWAAPDIKKVKPHIFDCKTKVCKKKAKRIARLKTRLKIAKYHYKKEREWVRWTSRYIPPCTWYGESGTGPEYAPVRYVTLNQAGSGAFGKFQFMPGTYHSVAKYHDWTPLDQEIAARRLYWRQGTTPWSACY